jgi:heme a synthase
MVLVNRFAILTACATWFLLIAGALVTSTGSGLSVPDWPLSYGQWMPPMVGGVFYEHGHRMVAGGVACMTLVLLILVVLRESRSWVRKTAYLASAMVLLQATLGGLTVLLRLPPAVSISHAMLGQTFFCVLTLLACVTHSEWETRAPGYRSADKPLFVFSALLTLGFFVQLFLGASVRHLHAGLSIPDFPTVYGGFLPPLWTPQISFHFAHRIGAYMLTVLAIALAFRIISKEKTDKTRVFLALTWVGLLTVQILLGALTIWLRRPVVVTAGHLAVGALCLVTSVVLSFRIGWAAFAPVDKRKRVFSGTVEAH